MNHHRDFEEMLCALSNEHAEFVIVGAYAVMAVTEPRYTKDLDVWIRPSRTNARKVYRALEAFGAPLSNLTLRDLEREVDGLDFVTSMERSTKGKYGKAKVAFLSVADLIKNKKKVGRPQDLLDVAKLEAISPKKPRAAKRPRPVTSKRR